MNDNVVLFRIATDVSGEKIFKTAVAGIKKSYKDVQHVAAATNQKITTQFDKSGKAIGQVFSADYMTTFNTGLKKMVNQSVIADKNGIRPLGNSVKALGANMKASGGMASDFTRALKRVIVVVPLWAALRAVMSAVTTTMREGYQTIIKLDKSLQMVKRTIETTGVDTAQVLKEIRIQALAMSKETGLAVDKITRGFYEFSTVGNSVETSMAGMNASVKQAVVLQGDVAQIAKVNAQLYKLLGHTIDSSLSPQEKQNMIIAKTTKLFRTNAFTIDEMAESLEKFLPFANAAHLTYDQTLTFMASLNTAAVKGGRAGRLFGTSLLKVVGNLDKVKKELKIFQEEGDTVNHIILKMIGALKKFEESGKGIPESFKKVSEIFGTRTGLSITALAAIEEELKENIDGVSGSLDEQRKTVDETNRSYKDMLESAGSLSDQNKNLKGLIGQAFLEGITGAENFDDALKIVNEQLKNLVVGMGNIGKGIKIAFDIVPINLFFKYLELQETKAKAVGKLLEDINEGFKGNLDTKELEDLLSLLQNADTKKLLLDADVDVSKFTKRLRELYEQKLQLKIDEESKSEVLKDAKDVADKASEEAKIIFSATFEEKWDDLIAQSKKNISEINGENESSAKDLISYTKKLVDEYNNAVIAGGYNVDLLDKEKIITTVLEGKYKEIKKLKLDNIFDEESLLEIIKKRLAAEEDSTKYNKEAADYAQEKYVAELKSVGMSDLEVQKRKLEYLRTTRGFEDDSLEVLKASRDVELERLKIVTNRVNQLKSSTQNAIKIGLEEGDINSFLDSFREGMRTTMLDSISAGLNEALFNMTGIGDIMANVFQTAEVTLPLAIGDAFETGGDSVANKIRAALGAGGMGETGGLGGAAGFAAGAGGAAGIGKTIGKETAKEQAKTSPFNMQNFQKVLGTGLLLAGLFSGGKSSSSISQKYQTADQFSGASTGSGTTRSTTRAKITNVVVNNNFEISGAALSEQSAIRDYAEAIRVVTRQVMDKLANESVSSGNY